MTFEGKHSNLTGKVIGAFFTVYNQLGYGFSEKVYENALAIELRKLDLEVQQQAPIEVFYDGQSVGEYFADILVNRLVMIELKSVKSMAEDHEAQLLNNLKATLIEVGLLLNFGPKAQHVRKMFDNERKGSMIWTKKD